MLKSIFKNRAVLISAVLMLTASVHVAQGVDDPSWPKPVPEADVEKIRMAIPDVSEVASPKQPRKLLVFYRAEAALSHPFAYANKMIELLAEKTGAFVPTFSKDYADLSAERLKDYDAIFLNNSAALKIKGFPERQAMLEFVRGGKGLVGIHAASDNFRDWPEGAAMLGGIMNGHPFWPIHALKEIPESPLTAMFPGTTFPIGDEIYIFTKNDHRKEPGFNQTYSRSKNKVLLSIAVDKSPHVQKTIKEIEEDPKNMYHGKLSEEHDYALSWIRTEGQGRVFYTTFGHDPSMFKNPSMVRHYMAGIQYALGDLKE